MRKIFFLAAGLLCMSMVLSSCSYNSIVSKEEEVKKQWGQVQTVYQRRTDLIPNLVNTVKGYAKHEQETLQQVVEARSKATSFNLNANDITPENLKKFQEAQNQVKSSLGRLLVVMEKYPDLKANQNFLELQAQLEGTENRISVERNKFNEVTADYNKTIRRFPNNITAKIFGFNQKAYFESSAGADKAPEVTF